MTAQFDLKRLKRYRTYIDSLYELFEKVTRKYACSFLIDNFDRSVKITLKAPNGDKIAVVKYDKYNKTLKRIDKNIKSHPEIIKAWMDEYDFMRF